MLTRRRFILKALLALQFIAPIAQAAPFSSQSDLLTGRLYAAEGLQDRTTGRIEFISIVQFEQDPPGGAMDDLRNLLPVFYIAPGEAVERPELRGTIARAHLLMAEQYGLTLREEDTQRYRDWDHRYPPAAWEIRRNKLLDCAIALKPMPECAAQ